MKTPAVPSITGVKGGNKSLVHILLVLTMLSFLLPNAQMLGGISPFSAALIGAVPLPYAVLCAFGTLVAVLAGAGGVSENGVTSLLILVLLLLGKMAVQAMRGEKKAWMQSGIFPVLLVFSSFLIVNLSGFLLFQTPWLEFVLRLCEGIIAAGLTYFLFVATQILIHRKSMLRCNQLEIASIGILLMVTILSLAGITIYEFHLGVIFAVICLYVLVDRAGVMGASVGGIMISFSLCLYDLTFLPLCAVLIVAAFIAGIFREGGRLAQVLIFVMISVFGVFIIGLSIPLLYSLIEILLGSALYFSLSKRRLQWVRFPAILASKTLEVDVAVKEDMEYRLAFAAESIHDLEQSLKTVSKNLEHLPKQDLSMIYDQTANTVCRSCGLKMICWEEHYGETVDAFHKLADRVRENHVITAVDVKQLPQLQCCRSSTLAHTLQQQYHGFHAKQKINRQIGEVRGLAIEQLAGVSQLLWEVSEEIADIKTVKPDVAALVYEVVGGLAIMPRHVACSVNRYDRLEIDIHTTSEMQIDPDTLREELERALGKSFAPLSVTLVGNKKRISVYEEATYELEHGSHQIASKNHNVCGDSFETFVDHRGQAYFICSDGMGNGQQAAIDSTMTCGMILKLLKAGFGMDSIVSFVNSSLQIKSDHESLATIDLAKIDLFTGEVTFLKAGSASSYLVMDQMVAAVETQSLPIGILRGISVDKKSYFLHAGDLVVLMSDGVMELGEAVIMKELKSGRNLSCQALSKQLCEKAATSITPHDDLTVMVGRLHR